MSQCILSDEGSGVSEYLCNRNETLEYSLKHGEVITNILGDTFPYIWQIGPLVAGSLVIAFMTYGLAYLESIRTLAKKLANLIEPDSKQVPVSYFL